MRTLRNYLQHRFNPLHVYCRLLDFGFTQRVAGRMSAIYERFIYRMYAGE